MGETQSFRLIGSTDIEEITYYRIGEQNVVYWGDIEQVFPGVKHVKNGKVTASLMRDSHGVWIVPHCIKQYSGVVLDVVLSSSADQPRLNCSVANPRLGPATHRADTSPYDAPADAPTHSPVDSPADPPTDSQLNYQLDGCPSSAIIHVLSSNPPSSSSAKKSGTSSSVALAESVSSLAIAAETSTDHSSTEPCQVFQSAVIHRLDGLHDQGAKTQQLAQEIWKLQKQMSDRLILIQSKTEAILNQQLELVEYPIPRLFIVLPEELTKYDPGNWFRTKFRLHFICECGKHTEASNSKVPHHLHLAKHEGYVIREPTEFFKKYGPFLLIMLELIKFGTSVAGHVVPTLASLKVVELADFVQHTVESVTAKIDYSLECIDSQLAKVQASSLGDFIDTDPRAISTQQDLDNYLSDVEGLEGVELRQLGSFLKAAEEENVLGNLYRMTTLEGHVKWVCRDHYRASYQEKHIQKLRDVVKLAQGEFDEQLGKIIITLTSSFAAAEFYNAVSNAKGVLELIVDLSWECTRSDLEVLEDALMKSRISILRLDLRQFRTSLGSKVLSASAQCKVLIRILEFPRMKMLHIVLPKEFIKLSNFQPKTHSHLCKLSLELITRSIGGKEFGRLAEALKTNSTLTTLDLRDNSIGDNGAQVLSEALKTNSTLATLDLRDNSIGDNGSQALSEVLKTNSTLITLDLRGNSIWFKGLLAFSEAFKTNSTLTTLDLRGNLIEDKIALALSEALMTNSALTTLDLRDNSIGDNGAQVLSEALKTNSTLTTLDLRDNSIGDNGAQALSEALKTNSTLTTLDLRDNSIWFKGLLAFSEAFKTNSTLAALDLRGNLIENKIALVLSEALKTNSALTTLNLSLNLIRDNGAQALSEALKTNPTVTTLHLRTNSIGSNGAQALSEALKTNSTLTTLNLRDNSIGSNGAQALSKALKSNLTLTTLDLLGNSIGDNGAQALSEVLKTNSTLTTLNLNLNSIGDNGAQALSEALKSNSTLTTLYLYNNSIGDNGAKALAEALKTNSTLATLDLGHNSIRSDGAKALAQALKTNSTLTTLNLKSKIYC